MGDPPISHKQRVQFEEHQSHNKFGRNSSIWDQRPPIAPSLIRQNSLDGLQQVVIYVYSNKQPKQYF